MNTTMPSRLCVPCRCPPEMRSTTQANHSVRNPNDREMVESGWSMSGRTPAPAVSTTPAARCATVTWSGAASAANATAPLSA